MPEFDWKAESNIELPQWTAFRFKSLREMVLSEDRYLPVIGLRCCDCLTSLS